MRLPYLVGDVVDASLRVGVLAVDTADLQQWHYYRSRNQEPGTVLVLLPYLELESVADGLEVGLGRDLGQTNVDGGTDGRTQIGGTERQPAKTIVSAIIG